MDADDCGLRKKVCNSGEIATWDAHVVHENDLFEFELGDNPSIRHQPALDNPGKPIGAYSIATLKSGEKSREVMSIAAIEKVRSRSRAKDNGPWVTDYEEMCRKTVARRQSKVLPMSTDLDDLLRRDDDLYDFEGARDEAKASEAARPRTLASLIASRSPRALRKRMYMLKLIPASKINRRQRRPLRQTPLMRRPARRLRTPPPVTRLRRTSPTNRTRRRSHWTRLNKSDGQEKRWPPISPHPQTSQLLRSRLPEIGRSILLPWPESAAVTRIARVIRARPSRLSTARRNARRKRSLGRKASTPRAPKMTRGGSDGSRIRRMGAS